MILARSSLLRSGPQVGVGNSWKNFSAWRRFFSIHVGSSFCSDICRTTCSLMPSSAISAYVIVSLWSKMSRLILLESCSLSSASVAAISLIPPVSRAWYLRVAHRLASSARPGSTPYINNSEDLLNVSVPGLRCGHRPSAAVSTSFRADSRGIAELPSNAAGHAPYSVKPAAKKNARAAFREARSVLVGPGDALLELLRDGCALAVELFHQHHEPLGLLLRAEFDEHLALQPLLLGDDALEHRDCPLDVLQRGILEELHPFPDITFHLLERLLYRGENLPLVLQHPLVPVRRCLVVP